MESKVYKTMLILTITATLGGFITLLPWPFASYPNALMYKSVCTFAPGATFFCFFIAGVTCYFRASLVKDREGTGGKRLLAHKKAWIPLLIILSLAIISSVKFAEIKAPYLDGTTEASYESF